MNELKSSTPVRKDDASEKNPPATETQPAPVNSEVVVDEDVIMQSESDASDGFIPLDPEVAAEEKDLLESRIYNEFDLEGMWKIVSIIYSANSLEGVGFEDEELPLDEKVATAQADLRKKEIEDAINEV